MGIELRGTDSPTKVIIAPATLADALEVGSTLRPEDRSECFLNSGLPPLAAVVGACRVSARSWAVRRGDRAVAVFGFATSPGKSRWASVWLLMGRGTEDVPRRVWLETSRRGFELLSYFCPNMGNHVSVRNRRVIRWLGWLGFTILEARPHGVAGSDFHPFIFSREVG